MDACYAKARQRAKLTEHNEFHTVGSLLYKTYELEESSDCGQQSVSTSSSRSIDDVDESFNTSHLLFCSNKALTTMGSSLM